MTTVDEFRNGIRRLAGGVSIVTAAGSMGWRGLTATSVTSLSAEPPSLLVCVNKSLEAVEAIKETRAFGVNVLRHSQTLLARQFAGMEGASGPDKFKQGDWLETELGALMLSEALVGLECSLFEQIDTSTHTVFMGHVERVLLGSEGQPLVYSDGQFATLAA